MFGGTLASTIVLGNITKKKDGATGFQTGRMLRLVRDDFAGIAETLRGILGAVQPQLQ